MDNRAVQLIAKQTMDFAKKVIKPGMKLAELRKQCEDKMMELKGIMTKMELWL